MIRGRPSPIIIDEVSDPIELARTMARFEKFDRNADWLEAHGDAVFAEYRGRCICVSEGEVFAADNATEAIELAKAAHPDDDGRMIYQVPREKAIRIYAC